MTERSRQRNDRFTYGSHDIDEAFRHLFPGDHLCVFYRSDEEQRDVVLAYISGGLDTGQKVVLAADLRCLGLIEEHLREKRSDIEELISRGQLSLMAAEDAYLRQEALDFDLIREVVRHQASLAVNQGFSGLRVTWDMSSAIRGELEALSLAEIEQRMTALLSSHRCIGLCLHNMKQLDAKVLLPVLRTHPIAVVGRSVYENIYYVSDEKQGTDTLSSELENALHNLVRHGETTRSLEKNQQRTRTILEASTDAIYLIDSRGMISDANASGAKRLGLPTTDLIGRTAAELFPVGLATSRMNIFQTVLQSGDAQRFQDEREGRWNDTVVSPLKDADGNVEGVVVVSRDITEIMLSEQRLATSERRLKRSEAIAQVGSWSLDLKTGTGYWSDEYYRLFGFEPGEIEPSIERFNAQIHPDDLEQLTAVINRAIVEQTMTEHEFRYFTRNGRERIGRSIAEFAYDEAEDRLSADGIFQDITEKRRIEAQLRQSQKMQAIGQLAGGIAHDFNNILFGMIGQASILALDVPRESPLGAGLEKIMIAGDRAKKLVSQILTFSRQDADEKVIMAPRAIVMEVLDLLQVSIPSSVKLVRDIATDTRAILADPTRIHEALMNLTSNAVFAMGEKGVLTVRLREKTVNDQRVGHLGSFSPGPYVAIEVSDTGIGISAAVEERIFEPFYTTKATGDGTGMGLAVVYGVMQAHGGNLDVESIEGQGSTFRLYFPCANELVSDAPETPLSSVQGAGERILFVDDESIIVDVMSKMLTELGYSVTATTDPSEAIALLENDPGQFDLLLTDQTMPLITGIELCQGAKALRPDLPLILITGFSTKINPDSAKALGISTICMKPLTIRQVGEVIRGVLGADR